MGEVDHALRSDFGPLVTTGPHHGDGPARLPTFSLSLATDAHQIHRLEWGRCTVLRTRDPARLIDGLVRHLAGARTPRGEVVRLRAAALVSDAGMVIVPDEERTELARLDRRLGQAGWRSADVSIVDLDPTTAQALVSDDLGIDVPALHAAAARAPRRSPDAPAPAGTYPVLAVLAAGRPAGQGDRAGRLRLLHRQLASTAPPSLRTLLMLADRLPFADLAPGPSQLLDLLDQLTG